MYRLFLVGAVFLAAASLAAAQDKKEQGTGTLIEAPDGRTGQGVVVLNQPISTATFVWFMCFILLFMLIILVEVIFMRYDLQKALGERR
jgi:nitrate/nitrite transporter NarK